MLVKDSIRRFDDEANASQTVRCSCGETTTVRQLSPNGKFYPANPNWKFRTLSDIGEKPETAGTTKGKNIGWFCGSPDHEQALD